MNFQMIWKKAKKCLALMLAITLFFSGWGNYDFSVLAAGELSIELSAQSATYTGEEIALPVISSVKDNTDTEVTSYDKVWTDVNGDEVTAEKVTNAGTYTLQVVETQDDGNGNLETTERTGTATFTVNVLDLAACTVTADAVTYTGAEIEPMNVVVKNGDVTVNADLYSVTNVANNKEPGTATFDIVSKDSNNTNVTGTGNGTFAINAIDLADCTVSAADVTYTGEEQKPEVTVMLNGTAVDSTFYQVEYSENTDAGTANFVVKPADGNNGLINEKSGTFTINAKALTDSMVSVSASNAIVTGDNFATELEITVKDGEKVLAEGTDYTLDMPGEMIVAGTYPIKVIGAGNYGETVEKQFSLAYATDGTALLSGQTLAEDVYADKVEIIPAEGSQISESVTGTFTDRIEYVSTPADYIVYVKDTTSNAITEYNLEDEFGKFEVDTDIPEISIKSEPAADWATSKDIVLNVSGADYGVFYTTTEANLDETITQAPTDMTELNGTTLTIAENVSEETEYFFYAIDYAGHVADVSTKVNKVDVDAPTLSVTGNDERLEGSVYWKSTDELVFTVKAEDQTELSGIKEIVVEGTATDGVSCTMNEGDSSVEGTFTVKEAGTYTLKAVDVAGNESDITTITVEEDTKAPEITLNEPQGTDAQTVKYFDNDDDDDVYWFDAADVTVPLTVADDLGADETTKSSYTVICSDKEDFSNATEVQVSADAANVELTIATSEKDYTYYFKVTDKAGNEGIVQTVKVGYDTTPADITEAVLTQLNGDSWINKKEFNGESKVEFSVETEDTETGIKGIEYSSDNGVNWEEAKYTEENGTYTFKTNETYKDSDAYVWRVRVTNNVDETSEFTLADGKIDTTAPDAKAYIKFLSDIKGANDLEKGTVDENGKWSSNIFEIVENTWKNIWGQTTITFEVYVKDNLSGINEIEMLYKDENSSNVVIDLEPVTGVKAFNIGDATSVDEADAADKKQKGYNVYTGEITLSQSAASDILVKDFQISSMTDVAGNVTSSIELKNAGKDVIYLDNVNPELVSVLIGEEAVNTDDRYLYKEEQDLKLTIKERFFKEEGVKYPTYTLNAVNAVDGTVINGTPVETTTDDWKPVDGTTDQWELTIPLTLVDGQEMEYQVQLSYEDSSENKLVGAGVAEGTFTSKVFVIDNSNPKLTAYAVNDATDCVVEGSNVYANVNENDMNIKFTIDDNAIDYDKSKANLVVNVYNVDDTDNAVLTLSEDSDELKKEFDGRSHKYEFNFDGEEEVSSKYYVEITYKDALELPLVDEAGLAVDENKAATLKSEEYIIDHVAPVFEKIEYSAATNVVKGGISDEGTSPLAGYTAYYNKDIKVTLTFNEKYYNVDDNEALEHFDIVVTKDETVIDTPEITWKHEGETHIAEFTIKALKDHSNDGDYQFGVRYRDCAENWMTVTAVEASNENTEDAGIYISPILVLDTTAPVVTTSYDGKPAQILEERDYFNADTMFNIEVVDRSIRYEELKVALAEMKSVNVDGDAIADTQLSKDIADITATEVQHTRGNENSAVWLLELDLSTEANYNIPVSYTDLAGNEAMVRFAEEAEVEIVALDEDENVVYTDYGTGYTEQVTVDKEINVDKIFIRFEGNVIGSNITNSMLDLESFDKENGNWISKIHAFVKGAWNKLWGNQEVSFELYVRDEIAGIYTLNMQYQESGNQNEIISYAYGESDEIIKLSLQDNRSAVKDDENGKAYVVYKGAITIPESKDVMVSDFRITSVVDKAKNEGTALFATENEENILHLDDVAPELISIKMQDNDSVVVNTDEKYFYNTSQTLVVTIDERFFGKEDRPIYPEYKVIKENKTTGEKTNPEKFTASKEEQWKSVTDEAGKTIEGQYYIEIPLALVDNSEVEYQIELKYQDAVGHALTTGGDISDGIADGTFTSKIFVIDDVAPVLTKVVIDEVMVDTDSMYFYDDTKAVELTIDERYFAGEENPVNPVFPSYKITTTSIKADDNKEKPDPVVVPTTIATENTPEDAKNVWRRNGTTNQYTLTIDLPKNEGFENEYQIELTYEDASGNKLVNVSEKYNSVENGKFTSKIFVIDDIAPELVDYSVATTKCDVQNASVLLNNTAENADDLVVNFTINDNPEYYAEKEDHAYSQENLIVKLYKEGKLVKTLQDGVDGVEALTKTVEGRNHTYSFSYDGEADTQDKFQVTVEYKDIVNHQMVDAEDTVTPGAVEEGMYTSELYIIDHIAPKFKIAYSDATNVVEGKRNHDADKEVAEGKKPLAGYTAYYNKDIEVKITLDEKYVNVMKDGKAVDCDNESQDPLAHFTFEITKNGKALVDDAVPEITWTHTNNKHIAAFTIKADAEEHSTDGDYQFVVKYRDCAANKMVATNDSNESTRETGEYKSPILVMDTTAPVLTKVAYDTIDDFNTVAGKDYVNAPTTMTFTLKEHNPTPTSAYSITTEGDQTAAWTIKGDTSKTTLLTVPMRNTKGDEQKVSMTIVDWAGNKAVVKDDSVLRSETNTTLKNGKFTDKFTVDTVAPKIKLEYVKYKPDRADVDGIDYFKQSITVKVTVTEHNFDADLFEQTVIKTDKDVKYKESEWTTSGDKHVKTFKFSKDNQYDLSIAGTDNSKNKLTLTDSSDMAEELNKKKSKVSVSVAVDSTIPAVGDTVKPVIVIKPTTPQDDTVDGQALYNGDVTYEVVVYDPLENDYASGIDNITFKVDGEDETSATCTVDKAGEISDGDGVTIKRVSGKVADLACGKANKYTFNVTISSKTFNTNGIVLWVGAEDVATTTNEEEADAIAIDVTAPKVVVSYDNNAVTNEKYFKDLRTATITVTERNFSNDCLSFIVNGSGKELDFKLAKEGSDNRDDAVWVAHYSFGADQDYTVDVDVKDRANNVGSTSFTGEAPQDFTIDMTMPKVTVEYDNNNVLNELYYKEARTATITIEEHNFSSDDVVIEFTATDDGATIANPSVSAWSSDGDYHRATIQYNYDGEFTFDIDFMDLATNEADDYEMDHFIIDLTVPELEIFDIEDMSANNDVVAPGVRYSDTNYDADGTVVEMVGYNNGLVEMTGSRTVTSKGVEFKLDDFERVPEMDDMYTMHATVYDLAGNSSEATVMFSVNRFGSVYTFDQATEDLVGKNGAYYTKNEPKLVVHETNVDTLEFQELTLNLNGKLKTLKEGTDFEISESGSAVSWKQYTYEISEKNFVEEGLYILTIYSEDRATNVSDNNVKGKKIEFVVDKTQPTLMITGVENGKQYKEDSREVTIDVEDNVSISRVEVTLNGETKTYSAIEVAEMNGKITMTVGSSNKRQNLKVEVYDAAGNDPVVQEVTEFLVTANLLVQYYMNKPLFYGSIGSVASLAALWWFMVAKKKNKNENVQN